MKRIARLLVRGSFLAALLMLPFVPSPTNAQVSVQIQLGVPLPPSPTLVVIQPGVQVVAGYPEEVFFQGGYYWLRRDAGWYRSSRPDAPFVVVESHSVPPVLVKRFAKGVVMKGFVQDIESLAVGNADFRRVLYTARNCQLVLMALKPKEEIGMEVHTLDQFFRVEEGSGDAILDGVRTKIQAGFAVLVPAGAKHNIVNTGSVPLKLYTIYSPPNHRDGVVHHTRAEAEADVEHFDAKTTE